MRSFRSGMMMVLALLAWSPGVSGAADRDEIRSKLLAAREKFAEMVHLGEIYESKKALGREIADRADVRREVHAYASQLKIMVDGYPARRNNLQQADYLEMLAARSRVTELDRQIGELKAAVREVDESVLGRAEVTGKRPGPANRQDILVVFPRAKQECLDAFDALRLAINEGNPDLAEANRLLHDVNDELNRSGQGDSQLGPSDPFFRALRNGKRPATPPTKAKAKEKAKK